jgi:general secretion pathway protein H
VVSRGFTLIELLVVLVIVGVVTSLAVISVRGDSIEEVSDEELRRLSALLTLASEQAVMEGREYGVLFDRYGYGFTRFQDEKWSRIEDDGLLRPRSLGRVLVFSLNLEGRPLPLPKQGKGGATPQVYLYSSGERTAFQLTIALPERPPFLRLRGKPFEAYEIDALGRP